MSGMQLRGNPEEQHFIESASFCLGFGHASTAGGGVPAQVAPHFFANEGCIHGKAIDLNIFHPLANGFRTPFKHTRGICAQATYHRQAMGYFVPQH